VSLADHPAVLWRRSQACNPVECVEVAFCGDRVLVRDSKQPEAGVLAFSRDEWRAFLLDLLPGCPPAVSSGHPPEIRSLVTANT
jgi:hypothetical protein